MRRYLAIALSAVGLPALFVLAATARLSAQDNLVVAISKGFTVDSNQPGQLLSRGSEIRQLAGGVTEVYGPDGKLLLRSLDSQSENITTPDGKRTPANHVYLAPSGSRVVRTAKELGIYSQESLILKVADTRTGRPMYADNATQPYPPSAVSGWAEEAHNRYEWETYDMDLFSSNWYVPANPTSNGALIYVFNSLSPANGGDSIIQPVLERNYYGDNTWSGAAWYGWNGNYVRANASSVRNIGVGDYCFGMLTYDHNAGAWNIEFFDATKNESSLEVADPAFPATNLWPSLVLEVYSPIADPTVSSDSYVPGDVAFQSISTWNGGNSVGVDWAPHYPPDDYPVGSPPWVPDLSRLQVVGAYQGTNGVTLRTTYTPALSLYPSNAINIHRDTATLNGNLQSTGSASSATVSFAWADHSYWYDSYFYEGYGAYSNITPPQSSGGGGFSYTLTGLSPNTTYHYKAKVIANGTVFESSDHTFTTPNDHLIAATAAAGGTISPSGNIYVNPDGSQTFTITPNAGYHIVDVQVDTVPQGPISSYTFNNVVADHTINATFAINVYPITATAGAGGSISPPGTIYVQYNGSVSYSIAASTGYHIADVQVDGNSQGAVSSYTFYNVVANHAITASFAVNTYSITASSGGGGSISPSGTVYVNYNGSQTFTITANTGYHVADVTVDGFSVGAVSSYTFLNVVANHTISASFAINTYSITASAGTGGWISPSGTVYVNYGGSQGFTIGANSGYGISNVLVDGISQGAITSYTFTSVNANHTISASFTQNPSVPSVTTSSATGVTSTSATLNGSLASLGTATSVAVSFEYGLTTSYGSAITASPSPMTSPGSFTASLTNLTPNTLYHFRAKGDGGSAGIGYGSDQMFTTSASGPTVIISINTSPPSGPTVIISVNTQ